MARISNGALRPRNEVPRRSGKTMRGTTNYISNSNSADNITALRLQRLRGAGLYGCAASLIASLAWGEPHHG